MIYEFTEHNLISLMQNVGTLDRDQLIRFFSDEMSETRIKKMLDKMVLQNFLKFDLKSNRYTYHAYPELKPDIIDKKIRAFWPIASWGSNEITQIYVLKYPFQYMVVTPENIAYDITVCSSTAEAQLAKNLWMRYAIAGVPDDVNHMAVVTSDKLGEQLQAYGFDMYCTLDSISHEPNYTLYE